MSSFVKGVFSFFYPHIDSSLGTEPNNIYSYHNPISIEGAAAYHKQQPLHFSILYAWIALPRFCNKAPALAT